MSKDWLTDLKNKGAYYCRDPEKFLRHIEGSESRKKFFFKEEVASRVRLWMVVEGISPIVLSYIDFEKETEADKWIQVKLKDFVEFSPLSVVFTKLTD